jgi:hypothetical protein
MAEIDVVIAGGQCLGNAIACDAPGDVMERVPS